MIHPELTSKKRKLDQLFSIVHNLPNDTDLEIISHLSRYLCIIVSGFIETSTQFIFSKYAENKSDKRVANFVLNKLERFQNPRIGKFQELIYIFSLDWGKDFESNIKDEWKTAVDSVVTTRNAIAHGKPTGISLRIIGNYYCEVVKFIEYLEKMCFSS